MSEQIQQRAFEVASPNLPHFAGLNWRLDVPRASRASASNPQGLNKTEPVYSIKLSLAQLQPGALDEYKNTTTTSDKKTTKNESKSSANDEEEDEGKSTSVAKIQDVAFSCTPETLLALADAVEDAVKQSEQPPYRRVGRMIK